MNMSGFAVSSKILNTKLFEFIQHKRDSPECIKQDAKAEEFVSAPEQGAAVKGVARLLCYPEPHSVTKEVLPLTTYSVAFICFEFRL